MAKFYINGGRNGAGWINGIRFPKPTEYETDDPEMIDALRNAGSVVAELFDEVEEPLPPEDMETVDSDPVGFADMSHAELKEACEARGLPVKRSKAQMIEQLEIDKE